MTTVTARLVDAKQASDFGFQIAGTHAYLFEVKDVMVGCLGPKDNEPGFQFDTITEEAYAYQLHTDEPSDLNNCRLIPVINRVIVAIDSIVKATSKEHVRENLGKVFEILGLERV